MIKNTKKIYIKKLFPYINNVNMKNLQIDDDSVHYITVPGESKKIIDIIESRMKHLNMKINNSSIVDVTAGVGGDTITFCSRFKNVTSIEIDQTRFECLKNNINEYKYINVNIINGDSTMIIQNLLNVDVVYIDPPWGGVNYKEKSDLKLKLGDVTIETFIKNSLNENIMSSCPKLIALKLPKNYDLEFMFNELNENTIMYKYELYKFDVIIIENK
jgi:16S rRNA G966 N2-methylase RsmD